MGNAQHYLKDLRAPMETHVSASPRAAVHQVEWRKIMAGGPVEITPSFGHGMKDMTVEEWSRHWKRNDDPKPKKPKKKKVVKKKVVKKKPAKKKAAKKKAAPK